MMKSGRHRSNALSAAFVRSVTKQGKYIDGNGLMLKVDPTGAKRWIQRVTVKGSPDLDTVTGKPKDKRKELAIGPASLISLAEARELALENRKLAWSGVDPRQRKREQQEQLTFEQAARKVHELNKPSWRNAKHADQFIKTLETYAFPRIGKIKIGQVSTADVLAVLQPIWLEKQETARRVRQRIGTIMKWAIANGWRLDNPAEAIAQALPRQTKAQQHRKSMPYADVSQFLETLRASKANEATKLALELVILTASRSGEVRLAEWAEFDLENGIWTRPAERMKSGKEHRVPLSGRAIDVLTRARALGDGSGLVFEGMRYGKPISDMTLLKLVKELGYDVHVHGFRTSFKTWAQEQTNSPRDVSEAALAHVVKDKAEAAYARSDFFEKRRKLMERWASYLLNSEQTVHLLPQEKIA